MIKKIIVKGIMLYSFRVKKRKEKKCKILKNPKTKGKLENKLREILVTKLWHSIKLINDLEDEKVKAYLAGQEDCYKDICLETNYLEKKIDIMNNIIKKMRGE